MTLARATVPITGVPRFSFTEASLLLNTAPEGSAMFARALAALAGVKLRRARIACMLDRGRLSMVAADRIASALRRWKGRVQGDPVPLLRTGALTRAFVRGNLVDAGNLYARWWAGSLPGPGLSLIDVTSAASAQGSLLFVAHGRTLSRVDPLPPCPRPVIQFALNVGTCPEAFVLFLPARAGAEEHTWALDVLDSAPTPAQRLICSPWWLARPLVLLVVDPATPNDAPIFAALRARGIVEVVR